MDEGTLVGRYVLTSYSVGSVTLDRGNSQSPQSRIPPSPHSAAVRQPLSAAAAGYPASRPTAPGAALTGDLSAGG